jgi:hypothetical protein
MPTKVEGSTRKDHAAEQFAVAHAVDAAHLDELRIDGADTVQRVEIDREKDAERDQKQLRALVDAEPEDHERNQREMRHVAHHLQSRIGQPGRELRQAVGEPEGEADAAADQKADRGAPEADPDVAHELAGEQELPTGKRDVAWRGQHASRHEPSDASRLPDHDDGERHDPLDQAVGAQRTRNARKTVDETHDCDACLCGR